METIEILTWSDISKIIAKLNPRLWQLLDEVKGVNNFHVIRATYSFGEDIVDKGNLIFNLNGKPLSWKSNALPKEIKKLLNYHWEAAPFGILVTNSIEFYINHHNNVLPFRLLQPGKTFGLLSIFNDPDFSYFITNLYSTKAGCRSLFMLPKITHELSSNKLTKKYGVTNHLNPKELSEHWQLFNEITQSPAFTTNWKAEIILFSHEFIANNIQTQQLRHGLLSSLWREVGFRVNEKTYNFVWSIFFDTLPLTLKNDTFIIQTVKHLILMAIGEAPGFVPEDSNLSGPITELTEVFLKDYRIRYHLPVFMRLNHYDGQQPIYYSLYKSTFIYEAPERNGPKQTINDLIKIRSLLYSFMDYILKDNFGHSLKDTAFYKALSKIEFDFFHPDGKGMIENDIEQLVKEDPRFINLPYKGFSEYNLTFPVHSVFFRGCVRIRPKKPSKIAIPPQGRGWML